MYIPYFSTFADQSFSDFSTKTFIYYYGQYNNCKTHSESTLLEVIIMIRQNFSNDQQAEIFIDNQMWKKGIATLDINVKITDIEFHEGADQIIEVYLGDETTYVVVDNRDFDEILIFKMSTIEYYAKWELFIQQDIYHQEDHSNLIFWFNIGQKGDSGVQWQNAIINGDFDCRTLKLQSYDNDGHEIWVKPNDPKAIIPKSVEGCFDTCWKVAKAVEDSYWSETDVHFDGKNWLHIYACFDMDDVNEYGISKDLWD